MSGATSEQLRVLCLGGGVSGTAMLIALVRAVEALPAPSRGPAAARLSVTVVDASGTFGPGLPYGDQAEPFHLLNMEARTVSLIPGRDLDFVSWLAEQGHEGPGLGDRFVPRHLFGTYVRQRLREHLTLGRRLGIALRLVPDTVTGVCRTGSGFAARLAGGGTLTGDRLVLASGHWRADVPGADPEHELDPWPAGRLTRDIREAQRVEVLGTSLTAVDAILTIAHARGTFHREPGGDLGYRPGPGGPVRIAARSRQGLLPMVRAVDSSASDNPYLAKEFLPDLGEGPGSPVTLETVRARLAAVLDWTATRCEAPGPVWSPVLSWCLPRPPAPSAPVRGEELRDETVRAVRLITAGLGLAAARDRAWSQFQTAVRGFFGPLAWLYRSMPVEERRRLVDGFLTPYLTESGAMPVHNAEKLAALLRGGVLTVHRGGGAARTDGPLVNAVGRPRALGPGSGIAWDAVTAGLVAADPLGGILTDPDTGLALDAEGAPIPDVAVLGPLTVGSYLGASSVYASVKFAMLVAARWAAVPALGSRPREVISP